MERFGSLSQRALPKSRVITVQLHRSEEERSLARILILVPFMTDSILPVARNSRSHLPRRAGSSTVAAPVSMPSSGKDHSHIIANLVATVLGLSLIVLGIVFCWDMVRYNGRPNDAVIITTGILLLGGAAFVVAGLRAIIRGNQVQEHREGEPERVQLTLLILLMLWPAVRAFGGPFSLGGFSWPLNFVVWVPCLYAALFLLIFAHEIGHLVAAVLQKRQPEIVAVGAGRTLWKKQHGKLSFVVGLLPLSGFVFTPEHERWTRREVFIFAAAGPLANVLLALLLMFLRDVAPSSMKLDFRMLMWYSFSMAATSLLPMNVSVGGRAVPSDGRLMLAALRPLS
jgi:hypothetical protein